MKNKQTDKQIDKFKKQLSNKHNEQLSNSYSLGTGVPPPL